MRGFVSFRGNYDKQHLTSKLRFSQSRCGFLFLIGRLISRECCSQKECRLVFYLCLKFACRIRLLDYLIFYFTPFYDRIFIFGDFSRIPLYHNFVCKIKLKSVQMVQKSFKIVFWTVNSGSGYDPNFLNIDRFSEILLVFAYYFYQCCWP